MAHPLLDPGQPKVVGSIGTAAVLAGVDEAEIRKACHIVEIRLDLLDDDTVEAKPWRRFGDLPLLFTARCEAEGGAPGLDADERLRRLRTSLDDAAIVDVELASADAMRALIGELAERDIPWLASCHDFSGTPAIDELEARRQAARQLGASGFKAAVDLGWEPGRLGPLALFLGHGDGFPVSLMGMGPLAPASRLLFAQLGSVLNYGYLGDTPTAPGQWSAFQLRQAIESVEKER
ncbi:type I 3-dehydroquinate dehydratase [Haloferula sp. A504]|uniref:type I 3-dehydroquinate dehydratase n=1 Tax=Haloferula sp. A504 TaxID=3373601 RepID=UPI0031C8145A|nr:type I 3-dehydroquinate dehydratase [Verrucomicrobiaceae bacterium E54]